MTRIRLRPAHGEQALAMLYEFPHDHTRWPDHVQRVAETIEVGRELLKDRLRLQRTVIIADLSCGDASIARALSAHARETLPDVPQRIMLGDIAPGYEFHGPIEATIHQITRADLFVCCETIEHLDDPDTVLRLIGHKASGLLLSTPLGEAYPVNPEHYWGWDDTDVKAMLERAGWTPVLYREVRCPAAGTAYQVWGCM